MYANEVELASELRAIAGYVQKLDQRVQECHIYMDYDAVTDRHFAAVNCPSIDIDTTRLLNARLWARFRTPQ